MATSVTSFIWFLCLMPLTLALSLNVASEGGNSSSDILYGILYEDIYHSGDGGMYAEMIRNRAFQGSNANGSANLDRNTRYWHPFGGASLAIDTSSPALSSALPFQMRMDVPASTTGTVGFYNEGFWGFNVDAAKRYTASMYVRGNYTGSVECYFKSNTSEAILGSTNISVNQRDSDGWVQTNSTVFQPSLSASNPNNSFYFAFDGAQLAGTSMYFNLLSVFKQTYKDRNNGLREDLALAVESLGARYLRMPGGNNMEGDYSPYYWKWNETIGELKSRPGRPGTWGDINTDGLGLLEQLQWADDMGQAVVLGVWAGLYLDGEVISEAQLDPYVDQVMQELEFLLGAASTEYGALRASLGYPNPFPIEYVEIGNEDYLNNGTDSYNAYRYSTFYAAIHAKYPSITLISTVNPAPNNMTGDAVDLHLYGTEVYFASLYDNFDQASRDHPIFVAEYAAINTNNNSDQAGAQTLGMALAEAIFLLGCERNSDVVIGTSYGALTKQYDEEPGTVAVMKHTANEVLLTMSYYVQKLFAANKGTSTVPVTSSGGGLGPVWWSATKSSEKTFLKLVNYNGTTGSASEVAVTIQNSTASSATLITMTAPSQDSVNNLPALGGEQSMITTTNITGSAGNFSVTFASTYQIAILVV